MEGGGFTNKDLNHNVVVDIILSNNIVRVTTTNWKSFGSILGVNELRITEMEESKRSGTLDYRTIFLDLLSHWKLAEGNNANLANLIDKLDLIGWKKVIDQLREKLSLPKKSDPSPTLFNKHPSYYEDFLKFSKNILIISTPSSKITIDRLKVNNPNIRLYSVMKFLDQTSMSNIVEYSKELIPLVNCDCKDGVFRALRGAEALTGNKIIFVTLEMENKIRDVLDSYQIDKDFVKLASDTILWNDITPIFQDKIESVATNSFEVDKDLFRGFIKSANNTLFLVNILKSASLNGSTQIPSESFHNCSSSIVHIPRFIVQNHVVSKNIFSECRNEYDDFYFIGIEPYEQPDDFEDDMVVRNFKEFLSKCCDEELTSKSLHLMTSHADGWKWLATRGKLDNVTGYILPHAESNIKQVDICKLTHNYIFAISDKSGIGKTSLFQNMLKENNACAFVSLPKLIKPLRHHSTNNETADLSEVFKLAVFEEFWNSKEIAESLNNFEAKEFKLHVFIDDYDKLDKADKDTAKKLFNMAQTLSPFFRFYVAGRSYVKNELETHLNALTVKLRPLTLEEQVGHLSKIWSEEKECDISNFLISLKDELGDIASFPLHCTLIGQEFRKFIRNVNAMKVMETLVKEKLNIYKQVNDDHDLNDYDMKYSNMKLGIVEMFREGDLPVNSVISCDEKILKIGIVETLKPKVKFIHKSFATYFAALWIMKCLQVPETIDSTFDIGSIISKAFEIYHKDKPNNTKIFRFRHKLLCRIIDTRLRISGSNEKVITNLQHYNLFENGTTENALSACVFDNFEFLFKMFIRTEHLDTLRTDFSLVLLSVERCSVSFVKLMSNRYTKSNDHLLKSLNEKAIKLLDAAVKRGNIYVFRYLVNQEKLLDCFWNIKKPLPLNDWFETSTDENPNIIQGKVQIIKFLRKRSDEVVTNLDFNSNCNICGSITHPDIIKELREMANCNSASSTLNTENTQKRSRSPESGLKNEAKKAKLSENGV